MRLRYVHFPRCGPLVDVGIVFGQERMLFGYTPQDPAKRKGAINFIVGVNGTGKSSLLRELYQAFRALKEHKLPGRPLTLAWDRFEGENRRTCLLHSPNGTEEKPWFAVLNAIDGFDHAIHWQGLVHRQGKFLDAHKNEIGPLHFVGDENPINTSLLQAHLPQRLVAYTSGAEILWDSLEQPSLNSDLIQEGTGETEGDRPPGWSIEQEWEAEQPVRLTNALTRFATKTMGEPIAGSGALSSLNPEVVQKLLAELEPMSTISKRVFRNQLLRAGRNIDGSFRVRSHDLKLAAISVGLWQAAKELKGRNADSDRQVLRKLLLEQRQKNQPGDDARRVFNALDWFWPTHLSFTYRDADDRVSKRQHEELLSLLALADEVTAQPRGRHRVVISLGPTASLDFKSRLKEVFPYGITSATLELIADSVEDSPTGAEAVMRVFSTNNDLDATLVELFEELRKWQQTGLLEDITLTIKRLNRTVSSNSEEDDVVVTYDHLSDGEQMLLGRMALLFLLRRQDGTLLLLDEPETHFNDVWKRELIDLIDDAILKTTTAQVVVATHTSIALTDVFKSEIVLLRRDLQTGEFYEADEPIETFGATPEDILREIFGASEIIGRRAAQILDLVLLTTASRGGAEHMWSTGEFSGEPLENLWKVAGRVPHSFSSPQELSDFLRAMWLFTKKEIGNDDPPSLLDTLKAIEKKLGPGHYQFEFRRRIHTQE